MKPSISLDHELVSVEDDAVVHAMLELTAPAGDTERPPLRLAAVVDRSGSMTGARLDCAKEAVTQLTQLLAGDDKLAVVAYDDTVQLVCPLQHPDAALSSKVASIQPGGTTNLSGGWTKGRELLADADSTRRVLLLTDGHANRGITAPDRLAGMAATAARAGVQTTSIGFGDGFNEELLAAIADRSGGGYFYAEQPDDLPLAFTEAFTDLAALVASAVSVEIRPTTDVGELAVLNAFPIDEVDGGLQVQVGELHAEQTRRVVFKLAVPALAALGPAKVADVVLRWTEVGDEVAQHTTTLPLVVNVVSAEDAAAQLPDAVVTDEVVILAAAKTAEDERRRADGGETDAAAAAMRQLADELDGYADRAAEPDRFHADAQRYRATADRLRSHWDAAASLALHEDVYRRSRSRPDRHR